jgi:hypothetical protein
MANKEGIHSYWDKVYSRSSFNQIWILKYWIFWIIVVFVLFQKFRLSKHVIFVHFTDHSAWECIKTWKVIMKTCSLINRIFNEWLVISQLFLFVITSISVSRITRALCKWTTVYDGGFTMIAVISKFKLTVWSIYMMFDDNYFEKSIAYKYG